MHLKKSVLFSCPFIPAEWIAAHGFFPERMGADPQGPRLHASEGICPYTKVFMNTAAHHKTASAVVFTTVCDQMRRAPEHLGKGCDKPVLLLHIPTTWRQSSAMALYKEELLRLGGFLVQLGGAKPTEEELAHTMLEFEQKRSLLKESRKRLTSREFSEALIRFHQNGDLPEKGKPIPKNGVPVAVVGSPFFIPHLEVMDTIEAFGGYVALDATTSGERALPAAFDWTQKPFTALAEAYFKTIPDAFRRPNDPLYQWLKNKVKSRDIQGVIFKRYTWCDTWRGEEQRIKETLKLPFIAIDTGDDKRINGSAINRILSFMELLT